ncbi:putative bifunctional diguanylate cyclase/phosphodiesterase [Actinoplanes italicus]|uniref:putative bifunctional diguanylate cyclase/phosphodiesterase n=1 Tax=Actinoplanes italicus TaxID=113567 RepID=UPI000D06F1FC|nr:bifunctional diguanylate cyclase/phosphodiesterase [Actinoplanes italicus]
MSRRVDTDALRKDYAEVPQSTSAGRDRGLLLATATVVVFSGVWLGAGLVHVWSHPWVGWLLLPVTAVLAGCTCWSVSRNSELDAGTRRFWWHLTLACGLFALGIVANTFDAVGGPAPSQQVGPVTLVLYLAVLGTVLWALLRLPSWQRSRSDWIRFGADAGIVLLTVGTLIWHFSLRDHERWVAQTGTAGPMLAITVVAGLSMATFVKVAFAGAGRLDRRAVYILAIGSAVSSALGSLSPFLIDRPYLSTSILAVPVAAFSIHLAAVSQQRAGNRQPLPRRSRQKISLVPYLAIAVTDILLLTSDISDPVQVRAMEVIAVALTAFVVVRQVIALRDNQRLLGTVDGQLNQLREYQVQLTHQATHDSLTGAGNRALFEQYTCGLLADGETFFVALLDLDDFKAVNDRLGHRVGDQLIQETSRRLSAVLGGNGLLTRLGGDEFAVVVQAADDVPALLEQLVVAVGQPAELDGATLRSGVSIGVTASRPDDDPAELLRRADVAMYAAKGTGGNGWQWFDPAMDIAADDSARLAADLRTALRDDQFFLLFQPIVSLPTGAATGVEALLRWQHPERGLVPPDVFIPVAERIGVINELGSWVFARACRQSADWAARYGDTAPMRISVNVSARQLADPHFVDAVTATLRETGADTRHLLIEVTETAVLNAGIAIEQLHRLKALGLRIALDDFGTGHSSLSLLLTCPVDVLKVDKSFVSGETAGRAADIIVKNIIGFTRDFGIAAVAEGVETAEQAEHLHRVGYRLAQGYHFGRPMAAEAFENRYLDKPAEVLSY